MGISGGNGTQGGNSRVRGGVPSPESTKTLAKILGIKKKKKKSK